eukprot:403336156
MLGDNNIFTMETVQTLNDGDVEDEACFGNFGYIGQRSSQQPSRIDNTSQQNHISKDETCRQIDFQNKQIQNFFQNSDDDKEQVLLIPNFNENTQNQSSIQDNPNEYEIRKLQPAAQSNFQTSKLQNDKIDIRSLKQKIINNQNNMSYTQRDSVKTKAAYTPTSATTKYNQYMIGNTSYQQTSIQKPDPRRNIFEKSYAQQLQTLNTTVNQIDSKLPSQLLKIQKEESQSSLGTPKVVILDGSDLNTPQHHHETQKYNQSTFTTRTRNIEQENGLTNQQKQLYSKTMIQVNEKVFNHNQKDNQSNFARIATSQIDIQKLGQNIGDNDTSIISNQSFSSPEMSRLSIAEGPQDSENPFRIKELIEDDQDQFIITKSPVKKLAKLRIASRIESSKNQLDQSLMSQSNSRQNTENIVNEEDNYEDYRQTPHIFIRDIKVEMKPAIAQKINDLNSNNISNLQKIHTQNFGKHGKLYNNHIITEKPLIGRQSLGQINHNDIYQVCYVIENKGKNTQCWFKVEKKYLKLALNKEMTNLIFSIDSSRNRVTVLRPEFNCLLISVNGNEKYELLNESQGTVDKIFQSIQYRLHQNKLEKIKKKTTESTLDHLSHVSLLGFQQIADTGDIIFFKGKTMGSKMQRFFTRCDFDHVALILKYKNEKIVLFESTGSSGVDLLTWDMFMERGFQNLYDEISIRHLNFKRTTDKVKILEEFIRSNNGKKYRLNAIDLLKSRTPSASKEQELDGYFCSELVAAAYQAIGLLPKERLASSYWPSTLADPSLKLLNGATLSHLISIQYEKKKVNSKDKK